MCRGYNMKILRNITHLTILFLLASCVQGIKEKTESNAESVATNKVVQPVISKFYVSGTSTLVVEGDNLADAKTVKIGQGNSFSELTIRTKTNSLIALSVPPAFKFFTDVAYTLFISNSYAQASFPITFVIDNNEITSAKIADGAITSAKLDSMSANAGQALIYNGASWGPGNLNGLNFMGSYTPATLTPPSGTPSNGDFYIVDTTVPTVDIDGNGLVTYFTGDWVVYDLANALWIKIDNTSTGNFWAKLGNDINYTQGNVSIGTTLTPALLTLSDTTLLGSANDGNFLEITGDTAVGTQWARSLSFGMEGNKHVRLGASGTTDGTTALVDQFYINMDSTDTTPWVSPDFVVTAGGFVGIKNVAPATELDVVGTITATSFVGDGTGLTNVTAAGNLNNVNDSTINADGNTNGTGEIKFQVAGVDQVIIDHSGNVGVGTSTTRSEMDIRSTAQTETSVMSYQSNEAMLTLGSNSGLAPGAEVSTLTSTTLGTLNFAGHDGTDFASSSTIQSNSTEAWGAAARGSNLVFSTTPNTTITPLERLRISHDGNVGIGNNSPTEVLDVTGNSLVSGNSTVGGNVAVTGTITSTGVITGPMAPTGGLNLSTNSGTWTTSNFEKNLEIGTAGTSGFIQYPLNNGVVFGTGVATAANGVADGVFRIVRSTAVNNSAVQNSDFEIDTNGDVTITNGLTVGGGMQFSSGIIATTGAFSGAVSGTTGTFTGDVTGVAGNFSGAVSGTTGTFTGAVSGTTGTFTGAVAGTTGTFSSTLTASAAAVVTTDLTVDTNTLFVDSTNDRVGVGILAPTFEVHVVGDIGVTGCVQDITGAATIGGTCISDVRFKKDIEEIESIADKFAKIRTVEYGWRVDEFPERDFPSGKTIGVLAQEVKEQFPELVIEQDDGFYKVNQSRLQIYANKALKEQIVRTQELEKENKQMKDFLCSKYADAPFCD